jgi:hypothetical protein
VFAGETHRPFNNGITHRPTPRETICVLAEIGLSGWRLSDKILAQVLTSRGTGQKIGFTRPWLELGRHALAPGSLSPLGPGSCFGWSRDGTA